MHQSRSYIKDNVLYSEVNLCIILSQSKDRNGCLFVACKGSETGNVRCICLDELLCVKLPNYAIYMKPLEIHYMPNLNCFKPIVKLQEMARRFEYCSKNARTLNFSDWIGKLFDNRGWQFHVHDQDSSMDRLFNLDKLLTICDFLQETVLSRHPSYEHEVRPNTIIEHGSNETCRCIAEFFSISYRNVPDLTTEQYVPNIPLDEHRENIGNQELGEAEILLEQLIEAKGVCDNKEDVSFGCKCYAEFNVKKSYCPCWKKLELIRLGKYGNKVTAVIFFYGHHEFIRIEIRVQGQSFWFNRKGLLSAEFITNVFAGCNFTLVFAKRHIGVEWSLSSYNERPNIKHRKRFTKQLCNFAEARVFPSKFIEPTISCKRPVRHMKCIVSMFGIDCYSSTDDSMIRNDDLTRFDKTRHE